LQLLINFHNCTTVYAFIDKTTLGYDTRNLISHSLCHFTSINQHLTKATKQIKTPLNYLDCDNFYNDDQIYNFKDPNSSNSDQLIQIMYARLQQLCKIERHLQVQKCHPYLFDFDNYLLKLFNNEYYIYNNFCNEYYIYNCFSWIEIKLHIMHLTWIRIRFSSTLSTLSLQNSKTQSIWKAIAVKLLL